MLLCIAPPANVDPMAPTVEWSPEADTYRSDAIAAEIATSLVILTATTEPATEHDTDPVDPVVSWCEAS